MSHPAKGRRLWGRGPSDFLLFGITAVELGILVFLTPSLTLTDWIYVCSNLLVLVIALNAPAGAGAGPIDRGGRGGAGFIHVLVRAGGTAESASRARDVAG